MLLQALNRLLPYHIDDLEDVIIALKAHVQSAAQSCCLLPACCMCHSPHFKAHTAALPSLLSGALSAGQAGLVGLTWGEFVKIAQDTVKERKLTPEELRLLFKTFDYDRSGFMEVSEIHAVSTEKGQHQKHRHHHQH